ncbi:MAG: hypothetical protein CVU07_00205 [Bacteroidetes bacterium HGW-Bacteroidetes-23]|nr:MAG: hypothetical protein CVU07_00205 [Bacteroidetes bacterium HGW-Bacteroidetes-23]
MIKTKLLLFLLLTISTLTAQISGTVKDSLTGKPIPYVNIWVENENIGTNSEVNGNFTIKANSSQKIIFSALGFETRTILSSKVQVVELSPKVYDLQEVILERRKSTNEVSFGDFSGINMNSGVTNVGQDDVHIWAKFIKSNEKIRNHPYLKSLEFKTRSRVKEALMRVRFFLADSEGNPNGDLLEEEILVSIKKGTKLNTVDVSNYNIKIPDEGIIIGFEYLKIEQNKREYFYTVQGEKGRRKEMYYEPVILGFFSDRSSLMILNKDGSFRSSTYGSIEIALKMNLTN